ncbi:MAG: hypothetical protein MEQ84_07995 [Mesorhizobium sp.]|nr:hypothetical protein [Mesorhizobium sp.]
MKGFGSRFSRVHRATRQCFRMSELRWFVFVTGCWAILFWFAGFAQLFPASHWFRVDRVEVMGAEAFTPPPMVVERQIRRPFRGEWIVTVMRRSAFGFHVHCTARGESDYRPENVLPEELTLDWWTWPTQCQLPPGSYYVNAIWTIHPPGYPAKEVRTTSNIFEMLPPG